jgi:Ca2+-binding EF-hand superfamily protein
MARFANSVALAFFLFSAPVAFGAEPRIALLDLFTDENSIRAQSAATNFTALLQVELSKHFQLVERAQIAVAEQELQLSTMNRSSVASGLRIGKWAKADFLLSGAFVTEGENRQLELTVINTANADAVAKTNLTLGPKSDAPLREFGSQVIKVAPAVSTFLKQAIEANSIRAQQITISIVYARPGNLPLSDEQTRKFTSWPVILENKVATNSAVRVVRLPEARAATAESSLILSGLVEADPEAITQVADYYVWATAEPITVFYRPPKNGERFEQLGRYKIRIWDGRTEPKTLISTNAPNASAFAQLSEVILEAAKTKPTGPVTPGVREKVSSEWTQTALDWMRNKYFSASTLEDRIEFNHLLRVFELASFVNPADPLPQEQSLFLRFNALSDLEESHLFRKAWAAGEAWGAYLDRFGPETHRRFTGIWRPFTVASSTMQWPGELVNAIPDYVGSDLGHGVPLDAPNSLKSQWRLFWLHEMARRAKLVSSKATDAAEALPWISSIGATYNYSALSPEELRARLEVMEALKPMIVEFGLVNKSGAAGYEAAYKALRKELKLPPASLAVTPAGARRAKLPRFDELQPQLATITTPIPLTPKQIIPATNAPTESPLTNEVLAWPSLVPALEPTRGEPIQQPDIYSGNEIAALLKSGGELFVALEQKVESQVEGEARDVKQTVGAALRKSVEFFRVEKNHLVPAFGGQRYSATNITRAGDSFVFMTSNRVACVLNGKVELGPSLDIVRPAGATAATSNDFFTLAFFTADAPAELTQFEIKSGAATKLLLAAQPHTVYGSARILAANDTHLCLIRGALEIFNRAQSTWTTADLIPRRPMSPGSRTSPYPYTYEVTADTNGAFWAAGQMGAAYANPSAHKSYLWASESSFVEARDKTTFDEVLRLIETARRDADPQKRLPLPHTRISGHAFHIAFDGKFAWVCLSDGSAILLDPDTEKIAQRVYVGPYPRDFAFANNALWIYSGSTLIKRNVRPAAGLAADEWTPIRFSIEDQEKALSQMRVTERAAFLLIDGEREKARAALAPKLTNSTARPQAIHLLLMALTFDPSHRETRQRAEYLERLLDVPGPIGAFAKTELERLRLEEPSDELFARYDENKDGFLSNAERAALSKDPSRIDQADLALTIKMRAVLERADLNRDGVLILAEIIQARHGDPETAAQLGYGIGMMGGPMSADFNHDGKITLEELVAHAKTNTTRFTPTFGRRTISNGPPMRMIGPGGPRPLTNNIPAPRP